MRSKIVTNANPTQEPEVSNVPSVLQRKVNRAAAAVNVNCSLDGCTHLGKRCPLPASHRAHIVQLPAPTQPLERGKMRSWLLT